MTPGLKIVGLGLSRTGTRSLNRALTALGYNCAHYKKPSALARVDAVTDIRVVPYYKILDRRYRNKKFILTTRNVFSWLAAMKRHYDRNRVEEISEKAKRVRIQVYGTSTYQPAKLLFAYVRHYMDVRLHFKGRRDDLLIMNITNGDGWDQLCPFLGEPIPGELFPCVRFAKISGETVGVELS